MSKLLSLKEWLTLAEAASHLSGIVKEPVSIADIYRFALAGKLVLSIDFVNHCRARLGRIKPIDEASLMVVPGRDGLKTVDKDVALSIPREGGKGAILQWVDDHRKYFDDGDLVLVVDGDRVSHDSVIDFERQVSTLTGIWDLPMIGAERVDIQHALQEEVGGPPVELITIDGPLVVHPETGQYAKILEHFSKNQFSDKNRKHPYDDLRSYYPAACLPEDASIIVRTASITEFVQKFVESSAPVAAKEMSTRERNSLLRIIVALAKEAKISIGEGQGGAATIESAVALAGFDGPKEKAIRSILADARKVT